MERLIAAIQANIAARGQGGPLPDTTGRTLYRCEGSDCTFRVVKREDGLYDIRHSTGITVTVGDGPLLLRAPEWQVVPTIRGH